jgi:hypothetical protein
MVKNRRVLVLAGAGLALVVAVWALNRTAPPPSAAPGGAAAAAPRGGGRAEGEMPVVGLERVRLAVVRPEVGRRDIFDFGADPREEQQRQEEEQQERMVVPVPDPTPTPVPTPTPLPPLTVKYIGSLESKPGLKVAFFVTEKKEVVSGQVGETVMNRFRVVRIGFESVDVQQVGAEQVQRLPLKGN